MAKRRVMKGTFCEEVLAPKEQFDKRSFRWKRSERAHVLVACPKGKWNAKKKYCRVGTRAHKLLAPRRGKSCPIGARRISK